MTSYTPKAWTITLTILIVAFSTPRSAQAHCDSLDGPVVNAARMALSEGDINLILMWVQKDDETSITQAFMQTLAVRSLSAEARELADTYFFETVVRIHRAGEGAHYTGLKPAGADFGPAIPASDKSLATGDVEPVVRLLSAETERGVREYFKKALAKQKFDKNNVQAGREFVTAYVEYTHYVEGVYDAASSVVHGHFPEAQGTPAPAHLHNE